MPRDFDGLSTAGSTTPPYAAYVAFDAFIRRSADEPVPVLIDKALLVEWGIAPGNESGVLTSLKSLGMIDEAGRPTDVYREIRLSPTRRIPALQRCIQHCYPGLAIDAASVSDDRLHDYFVEERGLTGQMVSKAMRFYRQIVATASEDTTGAERLPSPAAPRRQHQVTPIDRETPRQPSAFAPPPTPIRAPVERKRARKQDRRGAGEPGITIQVTVAPDIGEEALVTLFRRVRRAWSRARRVET